MLFFLLSQTYSFPSVFDGLILSYMFDLSSVESQGDEADCMYFIEDGEVRVTVKNQVNFCDPKTPPPQKKIETFSNFISISIIFCCTKFLFQFDYLILLLSLSVFSLQVSLYPCSIYISN